MVREITDQIRSILAAPLTLAEVSVVLHVHVAEEFVFVGSPMLRNRHHRTLLDKNKINNSNVFPGMTSPRAPNTRLHWNDPES